MNSSKETNGAVIGLKDSLAIFIEAKWKKNKEKKAALLKAAYSLCECPLVDTATNEAWRRQFCDAVVELLTATTTKQQKQS